MNLDITLQNQKILAVKFADFADLLIHVSHIFPKISFKIYFILKNLILAQKIQNFKRYV
jgi:hypothetical protein